MADKTFSDPGAMLRSGIVVLFMLLLAGCGTLAERDDEPAAIPSLNSAKFRARPRRRDPSVQR
jgi:hypothetical protein